MFSRFNPMRIFANAGPNGGPWGSGPRRPDNSGNNGGHGGKGPNGPRGTGDPDLDAVLRQAQERFRTVFGQGGGNGAPRPPRSSGPNISLAGIAAVAIGLWLASGFYRVEPQENAVILTFGEWSDTRTEAGLGYALPWPIQEVTKVDVAFDRRLEVGFRDQTGPRGGTDVPGESLMVTGDENIIDIDFVVLWNIMDARNYLFQIRDPESTVKKVAESAMREIIGRTPIQKALTEARGEVEISTRELMQKMLDEYQSGIKINSVQLLKVDPPSDVVDAFVDVQRARADRERARNEAETYRNDILPRARGEAQKLEQDAQAYKESILIRAQGDADRFAAIVSGYGGSRDVTQKRMYIETMQQVMQNSRKLIVSEGQNILPYLPVDTLNPAGKKPVAPQPPQATPAAR